MMEAYVILCTDKHQRQLVRNHEFITEAVHNARIFETEHTHLLNSHIKHINALYSDGKTREFSLLLMLNAVSHCSQAVLLEQGERWFRFCCQMLSSVAGVRAKSAACRVILCLLKDLPSVPELHRTITSKPAATLMQPLLSADPSWGVVALQCLHEYTKAAPGQCLSHKVAIEEHTLRHLDTPLPRVGHSSIVAMAGLVFATLPLPGMGSQGVQGRAEARGRQLAQLLAFAHALMDDLFDGVIEKEAYAETREHNLKVGVLEAAGESPFTQRLAVATRLCNTLTFIGELLTCEANAAITVRPQALLSVVVRLLQVDVSVVRKYKSQEHKLLCLLLPSLHHHCLLLLRDMFLSIGDSLDLYFGVLGELLQGLVQEKKTEVGTGMEGMGQQTKTLAYAALTTLVQVSQGRHSPHPALISQLVKDVVPRDEGVKLKSKGLASLSVQKAKNKKKGYKVTQSEASNKDGPVSRPEQVSRTIRLALALAQALLTCPSHSLPHKSHLLLQSTILKVAEWVVGGSGRRRVDLYSGEMRAQLLRAVVSLAVHPHPVSPPPYTLILHLLQTGLCDPDPEVSSVCRAGLANVGLIVANPQLTLYSQHHHQSTSNGENNGTLSQNDAEEQLSHADTNAHNESDEDHSEDEMEDKEEEIEGNKEPVEEEEEKESEREKEESEREGEEESEKVEEVDDDAEEGTDEGKQSFECEEDEETGEPESNDAVSELPQENGTYTTESEETKTSPIDERDQGKASKESRKQAGQTAGKRSAQENSVTGSTKKKKKDGPSIEEMLSSFVDADADD